MATAHDESEILPPTVDHTHMVHEGEDAAYAAAAGETSTAFDPFRPEGALDPSASQHARPPPPAADDGETGDQPFGNMVADDRSGVLENSASGAGNLSNPLSRPTSRPASQAERQQPPQAAASTEAPFASSDNPAARPPVARNSTLAGMQVRRATMNNGEGTMGRRTSGGMNNNNNNNMTLSKKNTLASMMLSGNYDPKEQSAPKVPAAAGRHNSQFGELGGELASEGSRSDGGRYVDANGAFADDEDGAEIYDPEGGTMNSGQIFMPNMRREAYVPARIARDKVKQVLKEMAQMKNMHYAALETMERQQEFLKAQLEATVATYARKLTADYNTRVKGLEAEYKRRLDGLNKTALGDLQATLEAAQRDSKLLEQRMQAQRVEQEREIERERAMFNQAVQNARRAAEEAERDAEKYKAMLKEKDVEIDKLQVDLRVARAVDKSATVSGGGDNAAVVAYEMKIAQLEKEVDDLKMEKQLLLDDRDAFEKAVYERDEEISKLQAQLADYAEGGGELVVNADEGEGEEEEEQNVLVAGGDDEEEEEGGGVVVAGDDE